MSAFIVNDKTINRILSFCFWTQDTFLKLDIQRILNKIGFSVRDEEEQQKLGEAIRELNFESIRQRYGDKSLKEDKKYFKEYKFIDIPLKERIIYQVYNHLRCLTYQLSEGNIPKTKLYKALEELENALAYSIANEKVEKLKCEWEAEEK